jgi:hypothetical protein
MHLQLLFAGGLANKTTVISRALLTHAQEHIRNGKKALSVVLHVRILTKHLFAGRILPSGTTIDNYYMYVQRKMSKVLCVNDPKPAAPVETINLMLSEEEFL